MSPTLCCSPSTFPHIAFLCLTFSALRWKLLILSRRVGVASCLEFEHSSQSVTSSSSSLQFLHLCGVVHRDVKPENLMFDGSNRLKLCDFGLAAEKIGQFVKTRSNLAGTPRYMAPEAFKNEPCSEKIDIFAFGMIVWEMYTGRLPWAGRSFSEVRSCVSSGTERPAIPSSAPPELVRLISGIPLCLLSLNPSMLIATPESDLFCQIAGRMIHIIDRTLPLSFLGLRYVFVCAPCVSYYQCSSSVLN